MKIHSIFKSINGEVNQGVQGRMCTFIRLQGCNLYHLNRKCTYCDSLSAFNPNLGKEMSIPQIMKEVKRLKCRYITITGGEPLLQKKELLNLLKKLRFENFEASIETNGTISLFHRIYYDTFFIVDWKLNSSGISNLMNIKNIEGIGKKDIIKFVIGTKEDFNQAVLVIKKISKYFYLSTIDNFAFSPIFGKVSPNKLLNWMKEANLNDSILNVQLHKILNIEEPE